MQQIELLHETIVARFRPGQAFGLQAVYQHVVPIWQSNFPDNTAPKASIRNLLQKLRDRGDLEFLEPGRYRLPAGETMQPKSPVVLRSQVCPMCALDEYEATEDVDGVVQLTCSGCGWEWHVR
jgi:hypothetical protein